MPKDVLITPASSKIEFKDVSSNIDGLIQLDGSDNLSITSPNGVLNLGNAAGHVYIGDGTNVTDLIFDQSGTIKAAAGKTLTIGQTGSSVTLVTPNIGVATGSSLFVSGPLITNAVTGSNQTAAGAFDYFSTNNAARILAWGPASTNPNIEFWAGQGGAAATRYGYINSTGLNVTGTGTFSSTITGTRLISTVATGTAPLTVSSTTVVTNLNADLFDGINSDKFVYGSTQAGSVTASVTQTFSEAAQWKSGFWEVNGASWTPNTNWFWGLTMAHTSAGPAYLYGAQLAAGIGTTDGLYFRTTNGGATPNATAWNKVAFLASPAFTGTPTAPTATAGTNTTQIATTAFVTGAGYGKISYQTTAPSSPTVGQIWVDSDEVVTSLNSNDFLLKSGGTMTGNLVVNGDLTVGGSFKGEEFMVVSLSDETTAITTGTAKLTWRAPYAMTLTQIPRASLSTASSSGLVTVDINESGASVLGANKLSIDANEKTSTTAATATTLADTAIADDAEITFDIDAAGTGAKGLKVIIYYKRT